MDKEIGYFTKRTAHTVIFSSISGYLILLLAIYLADPPTSVWIYLNLILSAPFILLSVIFWFWYSHLKYTFYLYVSFSLLLNSLNWGLLGLKALQSISYKTVVTFTIFYLLLLVFSSFISGRRQLHSTNSKANIVSFPIAASVISTLIGIFSSNMISKPVVNYVSGFVFILVATIMCLGVVPFWQKWYLSKKG